MNTMKTLTTAVAIAAAGTALTACGSSSPSATGSTVKKASVMSCAKTLQPLAGIGKIGLGVAQGKTATADAINQLKPFQATLAKIGTDNASNALGTAISKLTTDIANLQKTPPKDASGAKAAFSTLTSDAKGIKGACLGG